MIKREPLREEAYFIERIKYIDGIVEDRNRKLREQPEIYIKPLTFLWANFRNRYQQLLLSYSVGEKIQVLRLRFPAVVDAYEKYLNCPGGVPTKFADLDEYVTSLWLVSFALILNVDDDLFKRLLKCIGNEGQDQLFEKLVTTRVQGRTAAKSLKFPMIYQPLYDSIDAPSAVKSELVKQFLKKWYSGLSATYWHDTHKKPNAGFFGYWAVEASCVVKAFAIDDSAFRDAKYYPVDLVHA